MRRLSHFRSSNSKKEKKRKLGLRLSLLILGAQMLVPAFAARGCTDRVACVAVHADLHIEQPGFSLWELGHL